MGDLTCLTKALQAGAPKCKHLNRGKNMKRVLLTTTAIVGLTAPAFAADPTAVSDQPYFHHSHPMTWSGAMSIKLTNMSQKDRDSAVEKSIKRDFVFGNLAGLGAGAAGGVNEENIVGNVSPMNTAAADTDNTANHAQASAYIEAMRVAISAHDSYNLTTGAKLRKIISSPIPCSFHNITRFPSSPFQSAFP